jgi:hypothetical protein
MVSNYVGGYGDPTYMGRGDSATESRPFQLVGKGRLNLLDPMGRSREADQLMAAGGIEQPVPREGPVGFVQDYYDPANPGGLIGGLLSAVGQSVGGIFGKQGQEVGLFLGGAVGKTLEVPFNLASTMPLPTYALPFVDEANAQIEKSTPYLFRDVVKVPKTVGDLFGSALNAMGLLGRGMERTFAGMNALPEDLRRRVDAGEIDEDRAYDMMVMEGRGYSDNFVVNLIANIALDPLNWLTLGVGSVGAAAKGSIKLAEIVGKFGSTLDTVTHGAALGKLGDMVRSGQLVREADIAQLSRFDAYRLRTTMQRTALQEADHNPLVNLALLTRMHMVPSAREVLGHVDMATTSNLFYQVAEKAIRYTDPVTFIGGRLFGTGNIGKRTVEVLATAGNAAIFSAYGPQRVRLLTQIADAGGGGGSERILESLAVFDANLIQEYALSEHIADGMRAKAVPILNGADGHSLSPTEAARGIVGLGAFDASAGKQLELMAVRNIPPLYVRRAGETEEMLRQRLLTESRAKLQSMLGPTWDPNSLTAAHLDEQMAGLIHAAYYYDRGAAFHNEVVPALLRAKTAGVLPVSLADPERLTLLAERQLTSQRADALQAALSARNGQVVRSLIQRYKNFDWLDATKVPDSDLIPQVQEWLDVNKSRLPKEVDLIDPATGQRYAGLPKELDDWLADADAGFGYTLAEAPPADIPRPDLYGAIRDGDGMLMGMDPWLDFLPNPSATFTGNWKPSAPSRAEAYFSNVTRHVRQERIRWESQRRFITDMSKGSDSNGIDVAPAVSQKLWRAIMSEAEHQRIQPRGLAPDDIARIVRKAIEDGKQVQDGMTMALENLSHHQVMNAMLRATKGDLWTVGGTQWFTGRLKAYGPGARMNFWGQVSEKLFPLTRFTLNPVFQLQELAEPYILNRMRGVAAPLNRSSSHFKEALATHNAIMQLARTSVDPDGMMAESAEYLKLFASDYLGTRQNFGAQTIWGRISTKFRPGIGERKAALAALEARENFGERFYRTGVSMYGQEEWARRWSEFEEAAMSLDKGVVAMKWMATNMHLADVNGNEVSEVLDLLNAHNFGARFRITHEEAPGALTFKQLERHLDGVLQYDDGRTVQLYRQRLKPDGTPHAPGDALLTELRSMTEQDWMLQSKGIKGIVADDEALRTIWRMANAPTPAKFWAQYRKAYLQLVSGSNRSQTRALRTQELEFHKGLARIFAAAEGITEPEWIARHFNDKDYIRTFANAGFTAPKGVLLDLRPSFFTDALSRRELRVGSVLDMESHYRYFSGEPEWADAGDYLYKNVPLAALPARGGEPLGLPSAAIARQWAPLDDLVNEVGGSGSTLIRIRQAPAAGRPARFIPDEVARVSDEAYDWGVEPYRYHRLIERLDTMEMEVWDDEAKRWRPMSESKPYDPRVPAHSPPPPGIEAMYVPPGAKVSKTPGIYEVDINAITTDRMGNARVVYKGAGYAELNTWLRGVEYNGQQTIQNIEQTIADLRDLIANGALREPMKLHRGINLSRVDFEFPDSPMTIDYENLMVGDTFADPAFASYSSEETVARGFAHEGGHVYRHTSGTHRAVILHMDAPVGMHMAFVPGFEHEHIVDIDQTMRVTKVEQVKGTNRANGLPTIEYHITVVPEGTPYVGKTKRLVLDELTPSQQVNARFVRDAITDPDGLRLNATEHAAELGPTGQADVERIIGEAEKHLPSTRVEPAQSLADDAASLDEFDIESVGMAYADLRLRMQDMGGSDAMGVSLLHALARSVASEGGMTLGWKELLRRIETVWERGPGAEAPTAASIERALYKGIKYQPSEPLDAAVSDALDVMLGNRTRRTVGRGQVQEPVLVDQLAMMGAGYPEGTIPNEFTHEYTVDFYNRKAREANAEHWQGRGDWSAADMALMTSRRLELELGRTGIAVDPDLVLREQRTLAPGIYALPPSSDLQRLAPIIDILQQPENREQLVSFTEELATTLGLTLRDDLGVPIIAMDGRGVGLLGDGPAPVVPTTFLSSDGKADQVAEMVAYVTGQEELWGFSAVDVDELSDFTKLTPRIQLVFPPLTSEEGRLASTKLLGALQQKGIVRGVHASQTIDGDWVIDIVDDTGVLPRLDDSSLDIEAVQDELDAIYDNVDELGDGEVSFAESYGTVHKAGPSRLEDGTPDWEGHRDAVASRLQEAGSRVSAEDLDSLRTTWEHVYREKLSSIAPKQVRRAYNGEPIRPGILEDRRGGSVRGYTDIGADGRATIAAVGQPDVVTGLHELTHVFARSLDPSAKARIIASYTDDLTKARGDLNVRIAAAEAKAKTAASKSARTRATNEATALRAELGSLVDATDWGVEHEEYFVQQFLKYIRAGRTPNPEFTNTMEHFRKHIERLSKELFPKHGAQVPISPEMQGFFDMALRKKTRDMTVPYSVEHETLRMAAKQQLREAWDEAHGTHYYRKDRRWFERTVNHPYIGVYPASYMWGKVLPEMFRFLALRPFGYETPLLAWNVLREVSETMSYQAETNADFKEFLGNNDRAFMLLSMLFPAVPNDISSNASLPVRRVAEQGLMNAYKMSQGVPIGDQTGQVHDINYLSGLEDAVMYAIGPLGAARTAGEVMGMAQGAGQSLMGQTPETTDLTSGVVFR